MSVRYRIPYRLGFTPWERMTVLPVGEGEDVLYAGGDSTKDRVNGGPNQNRARVGGIDVLTGVEETF